MKPYLLPLIAALSTCPCFNLAAADSTDAALQARIDTMIKQIQVWAADPVVVNAVKAHNASPPARAASMSGEEWAKLTILDPFVRSFSKNEAGQFLKSRRGDVVSEAFLCGADGTKVAFLNKPSSWCHKGSAKHDVPMKGETWRGQVEVDDSSGLQQIQVAVPVLDAGNPIGSLTVGLSLDKLSRN